MTAAINWGDLMASSGADFEILPVGQYAAQVTKAEAKQSKNGKLMFTVTFRVISGPKTNRNITDNIVLSPENPRAVQAFFINLRALGVDEAFLKQTPAPAPETVAAKMVGAKAQISVTHREYQGQQRDNVDRINRLTGTAAAQAAAPSIVVPTAAAPVVPAPTPAPRVAAPTPVVDPWAGSEKDAGPTMGAPAATQESTVPIPAPVNPAPAATPVIPAAQTAPAAPAAPATPAAPAVPTIPDFANITF